MNREALIAELNKAAAEVSSLRGAETVDADALAAAVVTLEAVRAELKAFDAASTPTVIEAAPVASVSKSFGARAAEAITGAADPTATRVTIGSAWDDSTVAFPQNAGVVASVDAPVRFIDTLPTAPATSDAVTFVKEEGFANAAAARLAGDPTAESNITYTKVNLPVANIAHKMVVAEENLADVPVLASRIDAKGVSGVRAAINAQLLADTDTPNGVKSVRTGGGLEASNVFDGILDAKIGREALGFAPNYVAVSPDLFSQIVNAKTSAGAYIGAGPFGGSNGTIWGLNIVVDPAFAPNEALVYQNTGATLYVRDDAAVATDRDINTGMVTVRVQTRAQLALEQPEAFVRVVLS